MNEKVKIPATKAEIARAYEMSTDTFSRFLRANRTLFEALPNFNKNSKIMSPLERELIRTLLGDPMP